MGPRDVKDLSETGGQGNPPGKGKGSNRKTKNSSTASLLALTEDDIEEGISAVQRIARVLCFMQTYGQEIDDVERVWGQGMRQQDEIERLKTALSELTTQQSMEMGRLQKENNDYRKNVRQAEEEKEKLRGDQARLDDKRRAMEEDMKERKEKEVQDAKRELSEKFKTRFKEAKEQLEKTIQDLKGDKGRLEGAVKVLEDKLDVANRDFGRQKDDLQIEKRSFQTHIRSLESEMSQINALTVVSTRTPEFYDEGFHRLWKGIRDVAVNHFKYLPEDPRPFESDSVRDKLSAASPIFKYPLLASESPVATFLRACAIKHFLSVITTSIIQRRYFAKLKVADDVKQSNQSVDLILDAISDAAAATPNQDLSWRLLTVDKLERIGSRIPPTVPAFSTKPDESDIKKAILELLHYFQHPSDHEVYTKLTDIASTAITLWSALRKDKCRVEISWSPPTGDHAAWELTSYAAVNSPLISNLPGTTESPRLPVDDVVLFPRITGIFEAEGANPRVLHPGVALPADSPAFRESLLEIEHVDVAMRELKRGLRQGSSAQTSPVIDKRQQDWPPAPSALQ